MHFHGWYTDNSSCTQFVDTNITQNMEFWGFFEPIIEHKSTFAQWIVIECPSIAVITALAVLLILNLVNKKKENKVVWELIKPLLFKTLKIP